MLEKYRDYPVADRVFELAWSHSLVVLRQMNASEDDATRTIVSPACFTLSRSCALKPGDHRNRRTVRTVGLGNFRICR
ncbi:MAG: hypothetical protein ACLR9W_10665 [Enterobacter hormaechei]